MTAAGPEVGVLRDRIDDVHRSVSAAEVAVEAVPGPLQERLGTWVPDTASELHRELDELLAEVPAVAPPQVWARLHALSMRADEVVETCLALVAGAAQRHDDDICTIADGLVDEILARTGAGAWRSFTVPAAGEVYSVGSGSIGVRFPGSFWDLPVVAHEVGHLVAQKVVDREGAPMRRRIIAADREQSRVSRAHADELGADLTAAYLLGPAYAWCCVLRRFDPLLAEVAEETHPATTRRVHAVLAGLAALSGPRIHQVRTTLWRTWSALVVASSGAPPPPAGDDEFLAAVSAEVTGRLPTARYPGWAEAQRIGRALVDRGTPSPGAATLVDVVNGAWFARSLTPSRSEAIQDRARSLSLRVMGEP